MKKRIGLIALTVALLTGVVFSSTAPTYAAPRNQSHAAFLDKTRFLVHMGLAFYAFHHFIYAPYKAHDFAKGAPHRTSTIVKAALAALFAAHEVHVAYGIAKGSSSPTLKLLVKPIDKFNATLSTFGSKLKKDPGQYSDTFVNSMSGSANYIGSTAKKGGYGIKDIVTHIPGL